MIGGVVLEVSVRSEGRTCLWCAERRYDEFGERAGTGSECGVYVSSDGEVPAVGDDTWWQGALVFWTPADRRFRDRPLRRLGYSFGYSSASDEMRTGAAA